MNPYGRRGLWPRLVYLVIAAAYWAATRLAGRAGQTVVLCYHSIRREQLRDFAWQMRHIGRRAGSLATASGRGPDDQALVCVTFDDGFENVLRYALPAMEALGVPATVFAVAGNLGGPPRWSMPEGHPDRMALLANGAALDAAARQGLCSVGSHCYSHVHLSGLAAADMRHELRESRAVLEQLLQTRVTQLAFPYGDYDRACVEEAFSAGYVQLCTLEPRPSARNQDPRLVGRFLVAPDMWRLEFALTCAGAYAWLRVVRAVRRRLWSERRAGRPAIAGAMPT